MAGSELKPVRCWCGGEAYHDTTRGWIPMREDAFVVWHRVICKNCGTQTKAFYTEAEAIQAWNKAMGAKDINVPNKFATDTNVGDKERTAKVKEGWGLAMCESCKKRVYPNDIYCSHCGARLEWK